MMIRQFSLIAFFTIYFVNLPGQNSKKLLAEADTFFSHTMFANALPPYLDLLKDDPLNPDLNLKIGVCYLHSRSQKQKAFEYFSKSVAQSFTSSNQNNHLASAYKYIGDVYLLSHQFELARKSYNQYKKHADNISDECNNISEEVKWRIQLCQIGKEWESFVPSSTFKIAKLLNNFPEYEGKKNIPFNKSNSFLFEKKLNVSEHYMSDENVLHPGQSASWPSIALDCQEEEKETTVGISVDGQIILIYKNEKGKSNLYTSNLEANEWISAEKIDENFNNGEWELNEYLSADGQSLYFTSNVETGFGGYDIYKCNKLSNGEWSKAINLGPSINTEYDEVAPFIHPNNLTLFFSSNRNNALCVFDIFSSSLLPDTTWSPPLNVGYPINPSPLNNEVFTDPSKKSKTLNTSDEMQKMYLITFFDAKKMPITIFKNTVTDQEGKTPENLEIVISDLETGIITNKHIVNNQIGKHSFILPQKKNIISYEAPGYFPQYKYVDVSQESNYYQMNQTIRLIPLKEGSKIILNSSTHNEKMLNPNGFYLEQVLRLLSKNPGLILEISPCISLSENKEYTREDCLENIAFVVNYLNQKGINKNRIIARMPSRLKPQRVEDSSSISNSVDRGLSSGFEIKVVSISNY